MINLAKKAAKRSFGSIRKLPSGRFQARYTGPDGQTYTARHHLGGALTFDTRGDADTWLTDRRSEISRNTWTPPGEGTQTFGDYAVGWLAERDLSDRTREEYDQKLRDYILPTFASVPITDIEPAAVRTWYAELGDMTARTAAARGQSGRTARAHTYALLRTILNTAVADDVISRNPCRVSAAGQSPKRARAITPATTDDLEAIMAAMPERTHLLIMLAAWCALRRGELTELRRHDVDLERGALLVRRGVVRLKKTNTTQVNPTKSEAGNRTVHIPPHLMPLVRSHLDDHAAPGKDGLLFFGVRGPDTHLNESTLNDWYLKAKTAAGRPDLRMHDLRHTGSMLAALSGASLAELMARLGHSTAAAALKYLHAAKGRDREIADQLSRLAGAGGAGEST